MRIIVQAKSIVHQLRHGHHPGGIRTQASFQHPSVMFQNGIDRTNSRSFFALQLVTVPILAAGVAEFFVYPAPQGAPAEQTGG